MAIKKNLLTQEQYSNNFCDLHSPMTHLQAQAEADRCYFCYDAPCVQACPTSIDIPQFIRQIQTNNPIGSAKTILNSNIMGSMCARVCPTEELCEQVCVRETQERAPVQIGCLQRYATDELFANGQQVFTRMEDTNKIIAIVGGGPAGLSCAHALACLGHKVDILEKNNKAGGLNEYGIATYKATNNIAQQELAYILQIGGININYSQSLGADYTIDSLKNSYDAVFLGLGLGDVNNLDIQGAKDNNSLISAVDYISELRQATDYGDLAVGENVVVIGGGMTAVDIAIQSKKLGAKEVVIAYRREEQNMSASEYEINLARQNGVSVRCGLTPVTLHYHDNNLESIQFIDAENKKITIVADTIFTAIGQKLLINQLDVGIAVVNNRIAVDENFRTSDGKVWAGGDCTNAGENLTVVAVEQGKLAAQAINNYLLNI